MRILFFILSVTLLSSCSILQREVVGGDLKNNRVDESLHENCETFPYDESGTPCNLLGWQSFAYQSLTQTPEEHKAALLELENSPGAAYKELILLSNNSQKLETRSQATAAMFNLSKIHLNNFGQFFQRLAIYTEHELTNEKKAINLQSTLKKITNKNARLKTELDNAQSKIQAIIDIEKNINTN